MAILVRCAKGRVTARRLGWELWVGAFIFLVALPLSSAPNKTVMLCRLKMFLQSCRPALVLPNHKVAITEQSRDQVIDTGGTTRSSITLSLEKQAGV